jgi:hypothetical protein
MNEPTIEAPIYTPSSPILESRIGFIESALADGKAVRFHYYPESSHGFTKDINTFEPDEMGDLKAFRRTGGSTDWICWQSPFLSITAVDL